MQVAREFQEVLDQFQHKFSASYNKPYDEFAEICALRVRVAELERLLARWLLMDDKLDEDPYDAEFWERCELAESIADQTRLALLSLGGVREGDE